MMANVGRNKGIAYDAIPDCTFAIGLAKCCRWNADYCEECWKKIDFGKQLLRKEYWDEQACQLHLKGRLVAFNKKHPKVPELQDYRPIIVMSPVAKFL
jgi:hypothetical protein